MKIRSSSTILPIVAGLLLFGAAPVQAAREIPYPKYKPVFGLTPPDGWNAKEDTNAHILTLTPKDVGSQDRIILKEVPEGTTGDLEEVCAKCTDMAVDNPGFTDVKTFPPQMDKTPKRSLPFAAGGSRYKANGKPEYDFVIAFATSGKKYQLIAVFHDDAKKDAIQDALITLLESVNH